MDLLFYGIFAIITVIISVFLVVKYLPLRFRWVVSLFLLVITGILIRLLYSGVMEPIAFNKEKKIRYAKVIRNLKLIRDAEEKFMETKGFYSGSKKQLIQFISNDSLILTESVNEEKEIELGGGITKKVSVKRVDTIGKEPVLKYFKGKNYKKMFQVPGTDKEFYLATGKVEKITGLFVPVFEAKIEKSHILKGLSNSLIRQELQAVETDQIKGSFVTVGSLDEVSTAGNWPPFYDTSDEKNN